MNESPQFTGVITDVRVTKGAAVYGKQPLKIKHYPSLGCAAGEPAYITTSEGETVYLSWLESISLFFKLTTLEKLDAKHRSTPFKFGLGDTVEHVRSGGFYVITGLPNVNIIEATGEPAYLYRQLDGSLQFSRSQGLMEDSRFRLFKKGRSFPLNLF
jgi:hypothetical protein